MELKVGTANIRQQPMLPNHRMPGEGYSRFASRLGVLMPVKQAASVASAMIELHVLGQCAGHHLSYMAHAFQADGVVVGKPLPIADDTATSVEAGSRTSMLAARHDTVMMSPIRPSTLPATPSNRDIDLPALSREWPGYIGSQWSERRWQLLKRAEGVELLVRNYHLSNDEQADLATVLSARMAASSEPPERIWLNGRMVWSAASGVGTCSPGEDHGD